MSGWKLVGDKTLKKIRKRLNTDSDAAGDWQIRGAGKGRNQLYRMNDNASIRACYYPTGGVLVVVTDEDGQELKVVADIRVCQLPTYVLAAWQHLKNADKVLREVPAIDWQERALSVEARVKACAASLAETEKTDPDTLSDYDKGFLHGCQEMITILYGET